MCEPEVMDDPEQALAYARAPFEDVNQGFVNRFLHDYPHFTRGHVVDLGCGPADIPIRFVRALPQCRVTAVDASLPMIRLAQAAVLRAGLADRITLICQRLQSFTLPEPADAVLSNSLLHHLGDPLEFWSCLRNLLKPGGSVLVMDLRRPASPEAAQAIVDQYAADSPGILRRDFYRSLLAAFTEDEVAKQLAALGLSSLAVEVIDDRHWVVSGTMP
jgi:SAM-dependent methyltransferase